MYRTRESSPIFMSSFWRLFVVSGGITVTVTLWRMESVSCTTLYTPMPDLLIYVLHLSGKYRKIKCNISSADLPKRPNQASPSQTANRRLTRISRPTETRNYAFGNKTLTSVRQMTSYRPCVVWRSLTTHKWKRWLKAFFRKLSSHWRFRQPKG